MTTANDASTLDRARGLLLKQKRALLKSVSGIEHETGELVGSREALELEKNALRSALAVGFELEDRQVRELEEIDRALAKVAGQEYGDCERCGRSIAPERLDAVPATRYCVECERAVERETAAAAAGEPESSSADPPVPPDLADVEYRGRRDRARGARRP
jgi:DnaK suppressor protein